MADMTKNREAWLEWVNSKQGLMQHLGTQLLAAHMQAQAQAARGSRPGLAAEASGGGGGGEAARVELEAVQQQWEAERRHMQQEVRRCKGGLVPPYTHRTKRACD